MNRIGKKLIILGFFLITISASLVVYNNYKEIVAGKKSKEVLTIMKTTFNNTNQIIIDEEIKEMKMVNINGYDYIGTITIPSLNLELPIMSDYDYNRLNIAPCRYYGSIYTDDLIICAHSYKTHFKYLSNLKQKDIVIFTDVNGYNYFYEVLEIEVLNPKEVSEMIDNDFDLTLYTCTNDGLNRITVRCNKIINKV